MEEIMAYAQVEKCCICDGGTATLKKMRWDWEHKGKKYQLPVTYYECKDCGCSYFTGFQSAELGEQQEEIMKERSPS